MHDDRQSLVSRAVERHLGAPWRVTGVHALTGGAASATWRVEAAAGAAKRRLILRGSQGAETLPVALDKRSEARVQQAVHAAGQPVAAVLFELDDDDGLGEGYAMEHIDGESIARRILRGGEFAAARTLMTAQCARTLAAIHALDTAALPPLPELGAAAQIAKYRAMYLDCGEPLPSFDYGLRWLQRHCPPAAPPRLVHGDFRMGNFLVRPAEGIVAVLDWELAHLGDPLEDLGWLCVNSWRFGERDRPVGGFGRREELCESYAQASGRAVDPRELRYWEAFGVLKWGILCQRMAWAHLRGETRSVERAAIGRRVSETEVDLLELID